MIYKIQLSNSKETLQISENEYEIFKNNIGGGFIEFQNGLVNPSFVVSITIDIEASREQSKQLAREATKLELAPSQDKGTQKMIEVLEANKPEFLKD